MILNPQAMQAEKDPKKAAAKCFESIQLDPESYRIGHTKASICSLFLWNIFFFCFMEMATDSQKILK